MTNVMQTSDVQEYIYQHRIGVHICHWINALALKIAG